MFKSWSIYINDHFLSGVEIALDQILKLQKVPPYNSIDMPEEYLGSLLPISKMKKKFKANYILRKN